MPHNRLRPWLQLSIATLSLLITTQSMAWFHHQHDRDNQVITKSVQQPPAFDTILIDGPVTLKLQQNPSYKHHIKVSGPQGILVDLNLSITDRGLAVHLPSYDADHSEVTITVQTPAVTQLHQSDDSITSAYFRDQRTPLAVYLRDHSKLTLDGMVRLQSLKQQNQSQSQIAFTNSEQLSILLHDQSSASIAGRAKHVMAKIDDDSTLASQHLRADHTWLQAQNTSELSISPLQESHAFAQDQANIIYSTTPQHSTAYHNGAANVLRAR